MTTDQPNHDWRATLDTQVGQIQAGAEYSGWQFRIIEDAVMHVVYESRPPRGLRWRRMAASVGADGKVRIGRVADLGAVRAWRRLPRATRKALMSGKRAPETSQEASVALGFARFALSGAGLLSSFTALLGFAVVAALGLAVVGNGLDRLDYTIISVSMGAGAFRHFHVYRRLRASSDRALHPTDL